MATYFWVVGDTSLSDFSIAYSMRSQKVPPSRRHEAKRRIVQLRLRCDVRFCDCGRLLWSSSNVSRGSILLKNSKSAAVRFCCDVSVRESIRV
jgi:hypothetical protein